MSTDEIKKYLDTLSLVQALWWFIENIAEDNPRRSNIFFYLRSRYRTEVNHGT